MKNKILLLAAVLLLFLCGCGKKQEKVKLVILTNEEELDAQVSFVRGEKTLFSLKPQHRIGFMKFMGVCSDRTYFRACFEFAQSGMDYKPFLLDLKGDGDKRYLILTEWFGGNDAFNYRGYLIDTKDNFICLGEVPAGEICDYPLSNKAFVFTLSDSIAYFGAKGYAAVSVDFKLVKGAAPELVPGEWSEFSLEPYREMLKEKYDIPYDIALSTLYCHLANRGELSKAAHYARLLGVPAKDAWQVYLDCLAAMKRSRLRKHLEQLNGMTFETNRAVTP